jgi:GT2 family glycosyltransferase
MDPKVGIVITSWNSKQDTLECLRSVYQIQYSDFEVVVVDNGSKDGSADAIAAEFPQAALLCNSANAGFCIANNAGIRRAAADGAEYFMILNNDTVVDPCIIRQLRGVLDADSGLGAVSPLIEYYDSPGRLQFDGVIVDWANGGMFGAYRGRQMPQDGTLRATDFVSWCAVMFPVRVLDRVGFLDENFFAYYEDVDWSLRCRSAGFATRIYSKILVRHKGSRSSGGEYSSTVFYYFYRNRLFFMRKHAPALRKLQFSILYVLDVIRTYKRLAAENKPEAANNVLDALWSAICGARHEQKVTMPASMRSRMGFWGSLYLMRRTGLAVFGRGGAYT